QRGLHRTAHVGRDRCAGRCAARGGQVVTPPTNGGPASGARTPKTLFELSRAGRRAWSLPSIDGRAFGVPAQFARETPPRLPEIDEPALVRHYTQLSERNFA